YQDSVGKLPWFHFYLIDLSNLQGRSSFIPFFFLLHNFVLSPLEILKNIFPLVMHPKSTDGHRHGKGIIESGWICGVLG
ncbi:hypothetical protein DVA76_19875, partial [Acinetobacter baumannii]